ncbi:MAG TPA: AI-2E family transporter [Thermoanaerobaculia bacterium]|nr:AI-2E family transporter [Thermoanaerobaculia bacterium]
MDGEPRRGRDREGGGPGATPGAPSPSLARVAAGVAVGMLVVAGFLGLWYARDLVFVTVLGLLFGVGLTAPVDRLERAGVARWLGLLLVLAVVVLVVWLGSLWLGPRIAEQSREVRGQLPQAVERLATWFEAEAPAGADAQAVEETARSELLDSLGAVGRRLFRVLSSIVGLVSAVLLAVFIALWYAANPEPYRRALTRLLPQRSRPTARRALEEVETTWRRWLVGQLVSMTLVAVLTTAVLAILGVPAPIVLGLIAGLAEFIPVFGPILAAVPALLLALLEGPRMVLYVAIAYLVVQQLESNLITPLVMRQAVWVPPLLTVMAGALLVLFGGFLGLLVAVPLVAALLAVVRAGRGEDLFA